MKRFVFLLRVGIYDNFKVVNGNRKHLNKLYSIDVDSAVLAVKSLIARVA